MYLKELRLINFKNYKEAILHPSTGINCIIGENGSGKTNLLDAIHYLSFTKSAFNSSDTQNIHHEDSFFSLLAKIMKGKKELPLSCSLKKGAKKIFKFDGLEYEKLSSHIGEFPIVLIAPNDADLIRNGNEVRRKFFDSIISQMDQEYLQNLIEYNHNLLQRNSLLKFFRDNLRADHDLIVPYDRILIERGKAIFDKRVLFFQKYFPKFTSKYQFIADEQEETSITYSSQFSEDNPEKMLESYFTGDIESQRSSFGIHKDRWSFLINSDGLKQFGSQGQQKTFIIALKIAQFELLQEEKGFAPVLLLDDIFDKLDDNRIKHLMDLIADKSFGQIFLTDSRLERTRSILSALNLDGNYIAIRNGTISK